MACFSPLLPADEHEACHPKAINCLNIIGGDKKGTYTQIVDDIINISDDLGFPGLIIKNIETSGSLDNICKIVSPENAGIGLVQEDIFTLISNIYENQTCENGEKVINKISKLTKVYPLYSEEIHLLSKNFERLEQLESSNLEKIGIKRKARISIGKVGSGTSMTAKHVMKIKRILFEPFYGSVDESIAELKKDNIDAIFYVAGQPVDSFNKLDKKLYKFINIFGLDSHSYSPASLGKYGLGDHPPKTISVRSLLVAYDFCGDIRGNKDRIEYMSARCKQIEELKNRITINLENGNLYNKDFHEKWNEIEVYRRPIASIRIH